MNFRICCLTSLLTFFSACSDDAPSFDSQKIFDTANSILHTAHLETFKLDEWPIDSTFDCSLGGSMVMKTTFDNNGDFLDLLHTFSACKSGEYTFNGSLDYLSLESCPDQSFDFDIEGTLSIVGEGDCIIQAKEGCGAVYSGMACGETIQ